jgi:hypothetical protein
MPGLPVHQPHGPALFSAEGRPRHRLRDWPQPHFLCPRPFPPRTLNRRRPGAAPACPSLPPECPGGSPSTSSTKSSPARRSMSSFPSRMPSPRCAMRLSGTAMLAKSPSFCSGPKSSGFARRRIAPTAEGSPRGHAAPQFFIPAPGAALSYQMPTHCSRPRHRKTVTDTSASTTSAPMQSERSRLMRESGAAFVPCQSAGAGEVDGACFYGPNQPLRVLPAHHARRPARDKMSIAHPSSPPPPDSGRDWSRVRQRADDS